MTSAHRIRRASFSLLALLNLTVAGCGGSAESDGTKRTKETAAECEHEGETYADGESFPRGDGCNDCVCHDGETSCSFVLCAGDGDGDDGSSGGGGGCLYAGERLSLGEAIAHSDGCNTCTCQRDGTIGCTTADCVASLDASCDLPFDGGNCDAAIPSYFYDSFTGACESAIYGGCGGNENRYETLAECQDSCEAGRKSCVVGDVTYAHGEGNIPDPGSCNSCRCDDGDISHCTLVECPNECPEGTQLGTECVECGPGDGCVSVRTACMPECSSHGDCATGQCFEGVCKTICG